ncbi:MAG TPA: hydantoinase B/oxoprolinase family protein [Ramlibacter sp.]|uniref:hydantoinase B/oxoprolinase family protein n=1 Tax=Ramlibacter sp. TaxID=1917967 RepID=UPI002BF039EE|nr:hydantoinase B/oxoprolinase family protein [Ramlibacter sp.]HVZ46348.1 hydantoinase B/oxoprolinase family protein [Ramlibacter sp.]
MTSDDAQAGSRDIFAMEVVRHGLASIADEMTAVVMRAARSPALREAGDLSSALTDAQGGIIAQGNDLPIHLGVMATTVKALIATVGLAAIQPGDVWILNDVEVGGNHLPDVKIVRPVFVAAELVAFAVSLAHWADVGGGMPGSYHAAATDLWQEGLRMPPVRLVRADAYVEDVLALVKANVRGPMEREGDIRAQVAALRFGEKRLLELVERVSLAGFRSAIAQLHSLAEKQMRSVVASIPDGTYFGWDRIDSDYRTGGSPRVAVNVTVRGSDIDFDFTRSDDAIRSPLNTTRFVANSAVLYVLKAIAGEEIYHADGLARCITLRTRKGSIVDPPLGLPVAAGNHETSQRIVDAIVKALAQAIPERVCAGGCGTAGLLIFSGQRGNGNWWTFYETHGGGEGAHAHRDGCSATRVHLSNMANTPAEFVEREYPLKVLRSAVRAGSGGHGRHAGGNGIRREYLVLQDKVMLTTVFERGVIAPYGLFGGEDGAPFRVTIRRGGETQALDGCANTQLAEGDVVIVESAGGGGYGSRVAAPSAGAAVVEHGTG